MASESERIARAVWEKLMKNVDIVHGGIHEGCELDPADDCSLYGDILEAVNEAMEKEKE